MHNTFYLMLAVNISVATSVQLTTDSKSKRFFDSQLTFKLEFTRWEAFADMIEDDNDSLRHSISLRLCLLGVKIRNVLNR